MGDEYNAELCEQRRDKYDGDIKVLFAKADNHDYRLGALERMSTKFESIPETLKSIHADLRALSELKSTIHDNAYWVDVYKKSIVWVATIAIGGGLAMLTFNWVRQAVGVFVK